MAGHTPAIGPLFYYAVRASAHDLPEDFVARLEPGLDETTKASLETGLRILKRIRRLWKWTLVFAGIGLAALLGSITSPSLGMSDLWAALALAGLGALGLAAAAFLTAAGTAFAFRRHLHHLETFAEAMRRSSLARDIT